MSQEVLQEPEIHMLYFKLVGINSTKQLKHPNFPYSSTIRQMGPPPKKSTFYRCCPIKSSQITQPHCCNLQEKRMTDNFFMCDLVSDSQCHIKRLRVFKQMLVWIQRLKYFDFVQLIAQLDNLCCCSLGLCIDCPYPNNKEIQYSYVLDFVSLYSR